jgi:beta-fructofuranosidase
VLRLADHWIWDSWLARDGGEHHLFFLCAPRALGDPERRHLHAAIGHATSRDLRSWERRPDALVRSDPPAWDDQTLWTGSAIQGPDGRWHLFYTGLSQADEGIVQRIGSAVSRDLTTWTRSADGPLLESDPRWYERETWRDPFVMRDPGGDGWHLLITARADGGGVIGHARSADLEAWEVLEPLTRPAGFGYLEVPHPSVVDGQSVLMFSCDHKVWVAPGESVLGPWRIEDSVALEHPSLYAGRFVQDGDGRWCVIGFRDYEEGAFVGELADPLPLARHGRVVRIAGP